MFLNSNIQKIFNPIITFLENPDLQAHRSKYACVGVYVWVCVAAELRECEGDQYEGVYSCHATVRLCVCDSVSACECVCTCVRGSLCVPTGLATAGSIRQMITISTNVPPQPCFGRSVSLKSPHSPFNAHTHTDQNKHPHTWPTPLKANTKNEELHVYTYSI